MVRFSITIIYNAKYNAWSDMTDIGTILCMGATAWTSEPRSEGPRDDNAI